MRMMRAKAILFTVLLISISGTAFTQTSCVPTGNNNKVINFSCGISCDTVRLQVPHLKSTGDYALTTIPYNPFPYVTPTGSQDPVLYVDDRFSNTINMPFPFCFYDSVFSKVVVGSNGLITFDYQTNGSGTCANAYHVSPPIPLAGGTPCAQLTQWYYPQASIMAAYSDLDPSNSSFDRKIQWDVVGTAPCRKFIISFYHIGIFGASCGANFPNTFQIVLYESTGLIDIYFEQKLLCTSSSDNGKAILGIQDWTRTKAVAAPGKNGTQWTASNQGYRFTPNGSVSRFVSAEILTLGGTFIKSADTATTSAGLLDISFPDICPAGSSEQFLVKTTFSSCSGGADLISIDTITVNKTNSLNATEVHTNATCGAPDGTITVNVPAGVGTAPYQYSINGGAFQASNVFNGLAAGTYTVLVQDPNGCSSTLMPTIGINGSLTIQTVSTPTSCSGASNGTITVNPQNGAGPYQYNINQGPGGPWQNSNVFTGLAPGTYFIFVKDAFGCSANNIIATVGPGFPIAASAATSPASCNGVNNGSITVTPSTGTAPYQYALNGGPNQASNIFSGLAPGTYFINVTDAGGCVLNNLQAIVGVGQPLAASASSTPTSCSGATNGSITVTPTNGTGPFQYAIDGGALQASNIFNGVASGLHNINIVDAGGCTLTGLQVTVTAGPPLSATTSISPTSCSGATNGSITVTPSSGAAPYQYSIDGSALQASNIFNGVSSGLHNINIVDAGGCTLTGLQVNVTAGPPLAATAMSTATTCSGASNGTVTVTPSTGAAPYQYSIDGGALQAANTFSGLAAGSHTVNIVDAGGCTLNGLSVSVATGPPLAATAVTTPTSCSGAVNGTITVTPTNGSGPFQYSLNGGPYQASNVFTGLAANNYSINIADAGGCSLNNLPAVVSPGVPLTATTTKTDVTCNGAANGSITVNIGPGLGTPPYQYSVDGINYQNSNTISGLTAGTYTVFFKDNNGCAGTTAVTISQPQVLTANAAVQPVLCNGQSNGLIIMSPSGGTSPYQFSTDGVTYQSRDSFAVAAGTYTVYTRDNLGCLSTQNNIVVTEPALLTVSGIATDASCDGGNDGKITITAGGGNGNYQYSLDGVNYQNANIFNVAPGNYSFTVKDAKNCTANGSIVVGLTNNLTLSPANDATICEGSSVQLQVNSNATQYVWQAAPGLSSSTIANPTASPVTTTNYIVTATLGRCSINDTILVQVLPAPIPDAGPDGFICFGQSYQLQGSGGVQFSWSPSTYLDDPLSPAPLVNPAKTTLYDLSVTDTNGCTSVITDQVKVDVTPPIVVLTIPKDTVVYSGDQFQLSASSVGTDYSWSPSVGLSDPNIPNPVITVNNDITLTVTASTIAGCKGTADIIIKVYNGPDLYVPSAFTPNGDGKNDIFRPFPVGIKELRYFRIYNRWGRLMYSTTQLNEGWDGKYLGVEQGIAVYVWMAQGVTRDGRIITKKGTVTLIR